MVEYSSYLYSNLFINKDIFSAREEESFKKELANTLRVKNPEWISKSRFSRWHGWRATTREYNVYFRETVSQFILPRNYTSDLLDRYFEEHPFKDRKIRGVKTSYSFYPKLRSYQEAYFLKYPQLLCTDDKIVNAACGTGKTLMGVYMSWMFKTPTLVLVPTHYLANQWMEKIKEYTDASYYVWKSTDAELPLDKDFYIVSFDLFTLRELAKNFVERIGHVILDEAHRTGAETYLPILNMLPAKRRTALTATFRRGDGMHRILSYHFGEVCRMEYEQPRPIVYPVKLGIKADCVINKKGKWELLKEYLVDEFNEKISETSTCMEFTYNYEFKKRLPGKKYAMTKENALKNILNKSEKQNTAILYNYLTENKRRRRRVVFIIEECMQSGRTVLFLSKRKNSLKRYHKTFACYKPVLVISKSTDKMSAVEKEYMQKDCRLIFGIEQLAKEGLDIDRIDTVIFDLPIKDTEQPIGRSTRVLPGKKQSVILYLLDENSLCFGLFNAAKRFIKINAVMGCEIIWKNVKQIL